MANQILDILLNGLLGKHKDIGSTSHQKRELVRGDVICIRDGFSSRYGVWTGKAVILYGKSPQGRHAVHERTLKDFLQGAAKYSICSFPAKYGHPRMIEHASPIQGVIMPQDKLWRMLRQAEKARRYKRYSQTAVRAENALGKRNFCSSEHFAVWCKTGIAESHELENWRELLDRVIIY